jgi:hypothetical protein
VKPLLREHERAGQPACASADDDGFIVAAQGNLRLRF